MHQVVEPSLFTATLQVAFGAHARELDEVADHVGLIEVPARERDRWYEEQKLLGEQQCRA